MHGFRNLTVMNGEPLRSPMVPKSGVLPSTTMEKFILGLKEIFGYYERNKEGYLQLFQSGQAGNNWQPICA